MKKRSNVSFVWVWFFRAVLLASGLILAGLAIHPDGVDLRIFMYFNADKILHSLIGFTLTALALLSMPKVNAVKIFSSIVIVIGLVEMAQLIGPRSADPMDFLMGALGIVIVAFLYQLSRIRSYLSLADDTTT